MKQTFFSGLFAPDLVFPGGGFWLLPAPGDLTKQGGGISPQQGGEKYRLYIVDAGGWFWLDIKTFKARTCTSHLPHKTLEPRTDCYGDLHVFPVRAIFKGSRHQILAEPQAHPGLCSPAFKRRGRRTETLLQSGEEG